MSFTPPSTFPDSSGGANAGQWGNFTLSHASTSGTKYYYEWFSGGFEIYYDTATQKWHDPNTTNEPHSLSSTNSSTAGSDSGVVVNGDTIYCHDTSTGTSAVLYQFTMSGGVNASSGGGGGGFLSTNPKIENLTFTKTSDSSVDVSFDWENIGSYTITNSRAGVPQTVSANLSGSSGTENGSVSLTCQEGDLLWIHGNYNNNSLEHHPSIYGSQSNPYVFRVVNFSVSGTTLTATTFFSGSTGLNNDADFRVWDPDVQSWNRLDYINYDGTLQTKTVTPFTRGHIYYVVDRSTGNDYGMRYVAPGTGRRTRGRTFW